MITLVFMLLLAVGQSHKCCSVELLNIVIGLLIGCTLKRKLLYNVEVQCYIY